MSMTKHSRDRVRLMASSFPEARARWSSLQQPRRALILPRRGGGHHSPCRVWLDATWRVTSVFLPGSP